MNAFVGRYAAEIKGTLSGFDRVRFRGTLRWLSSSRGMESYLVTNKVLLKNFTEWAAHKTKCIQDATDQLVESTGRPLVYLPSSKERKETRALTIAQADQIQEGLVAVFKSVEPCHTFTVGPNAAQKRLELRHKPAKCSHLYFYELHRELGLIHLRLQT
jgi:hypothetical protein